MDFFSFSDFIKVINVYIEAEEPYLNKAFDCCYNTKFTLVDIANIINNLSDYKVIINVTDDKGMGDEYTGEYIPIHNLNYKGLKKSIEDMFNILKTNTNILS